MYKLYSQILFLKDFIQCKRAGLNWVDFLKLTIRKPNTGSVRFQDNHILITHWFWFIHGVKELFVDKSYYFSTNSTEPLIIDCGANIGMSVLYFKQLHPNSKVICFEPDKNLFEILKKNIQSYNLSNVEIINKAIWKEENLVHFDANGQVGGRIDQKNQGIPIKTIRLKNILNQKIDFLKIDIEGAEYDVLMDCKDDLHQVENIFIEYHSQPDSTQRLQAILEVLTHAGFRYYIKEAWPNRLHPYIEKNTMNSVYDLQVNIFGFRI